MKIDKNMDISIEIDGDIIAEIHSKITQENIVSIVQTVKQKLLDYNLDKEKIFNIYDISIELLQNILKYSYGNKIDEENKREADGAFIVAYNSKTENFIITSANLISVSQMEVIEQRLKEVEGLDEKGLRKLLRSKMKLRKDGHANGAGLGFATIASKTFMPLEVKFEKVLQNVIKYTLTVVV